MTLTPVEVRHLELRRGLFGYRRNQVHHTIEEIADSFEAVWRERSELGSASTSSSPRSHGTSSWRPCSGRRSSLQNGPRRT